MRYDEIRKIITSSSAADWAVLGIGPLYLDRLSQISAGSETWFEVDSHYYLAVWRNDVNLRLAWGLEIAGRVAYEGFVMPDPRISRFVADAFWQGALVARWHLLTVDGGRCYLPDPKREITKTSETAPERQEAFRWTAKASEVALARLLNDIVGRDDGRFDLYLGAQITEVPDEQPLPEQNVRLATTS